MPKFMISIKTITGVCGAGVVLEVGLGVVDQRHAHDCEVADIEQQRLTESEFIMFSTKLIILNTNFIVLTTNDLPGGLAA